MPPLGSAPASFAPIDAPPDLAESARQYRLVARTIDYIRAHAAQQPSLDEMAAAVHLSPAHLQRVFSQWAGLSPKRFLQFLTKEHALQQLAASDTVLAASERCGLSSAGRLHDLMVSCEAMTPGDIQAQGRGLTVGTGLAPTPFGTALLGWTARGLCHLAFVDDTAATDPVWLLAARWPLAQVVRDDGAAHAWAQRLFPRWPERGQIHLVLRGTNFQIRVWQALMALPPGQVVSYQQLARQIGQPRASRAVGSALADNVVGFLIPCHRVIKGTGDVGQYRWGSERKLAMQAWEAARHAA